MTSESIDITHKKSSNISDKLSCVPLSSIRKILPDEAIQQACHDAGYSFRNRLITPVTIILHMLLSAIWPEESFNASWQVLWSLFKSRYPQSSQTDPSRGTVANARNRLPVLVWDKLFALVSQQAQRLSLPWAY